MRDKNEGEYFDNKQLAKETAYERDFWKFNSSLLLEDATSFGFLAWFVARLKFFKTAANPEVTCQIHCIFIKFWRKLSLLPSEYSWALQRSISAR
jgi:hypothetical protein